MRKAFTFVFLVGLSALSFGSSDREPTKDELLRMKSRAVQGDGDSAYDLFIYYASSRSVTGEEGLEWLIRGVRLGDDESIKAYRTLQKDRVIEKWLQNCLETGIEIQQKRQKEWDDFNAKQKAELKE